MDVQQSKKVPIYNRVSTVKQSDKEFSSLDAQDSMCNSFQKGKGKENYDIYNVYIDTKSAKKLNRPGLTQLRKDAADGKFELVVITKFDRISRDVKEFLELVEKFESKGVDIALTTLSIDTSAPWGKFQHNLMLNLAQFEREMNAARTSEKERKL